VNKEELLKDELCALSDFGQAIDEQFVHLSAERCLRILEESGETALDMEEEDE